MLVGEVIVQRLNLQVLWTQPAPSEDAKVCGIGWRPDERILAIGKTAFVHHIENTTFYFQFQFIRLQQWKSHFG